MEIEAELCFIYKTIRAYSQYEEYIEQKLQGKFIKNKVMEGYLITKEYLNYWKKYSDYEDLKDLVNCNKYQNIRPTLYKYRKSNKYQAYQPDAIQIIIKSPEDLYRQVKKENKAFVLIDYNFWQLICTQSGLKQRGEARFSLGKDCITFILVNWIIVKLSLMTILLIHLKKLNLQDLMLLDKVTKKNKN